jgi:GNAT superfamily N-acetyltransferase
MILRSMNETDIDNYCVLYKRIFIQPPWNEEWAIDKIKSIVLKNMNRKGFIGLVAEQESQGLAGYSNGYRLPALRLFYLDQLFIDDRCRGIGIGRKLLLEMVHLNNSGIVLLTKANSPAERFYVCNGFKRFIPLIRIRGKILLYKRGSNEK